MYFYSNKGVSSVFESKLVWRLMIADIYDQKIT